jgi:eukaryotic-like serine/threonine-protein kinase
MELPSRIGRYEVEHLLGQGGMGRVLLARDTVLGREVALKILRDDLGLTPEMKTQLVDRMRQEARTAATLSHPVMVTLHDMGQDENVGLYLVFERILGPTLRQQIEQKGPLAPTAVAELARALGTALTYAHGQGVVHRDVKPENVMLSPNGPKLADFGIARLPNSTLTQASTVLGTPAYSAPEGLATGTFGAASDQFSLAATLYEALTGQRAFRGDDALTVATRVATGKHPAPTAALPALRGFEHVDVIFDRALAKEPRNRFGSCQVFGNALAAELEGANAAYMMTPIPRSSIAMRATRRWQNMAALTALAVIVGLVVVGRSRRPDEDGVSLRSVASAFAASAVTVRAPAPSGTGLVSHHVRNQAGTSPSVSVSSQPTVPPAASLAHRPEGTPSGSDEPALDSRPSDAAHTPPELRSADAVAPSDTPQR